MKRRVCVAAPHTSVSLSEPVPALHCGIAKPVFLPSHSGPIDINELPSSEEDRGGRDRGGNLQ